MHLFFQLEEYRNAEAKVLEMLSQFPGLVEPQADENGEVATMELLHRVFEDLSKGNASLKKEVEHHQEVSKMEAEGQRVLMTAITEIEVKSHKSIFTTALDLLHDFQIEAFEFRCIFWQEN